MRCDSRGRGNGGVRHKAASSREDRAALDPARSKPQRQAADTGDANAEPLHAAKQRPGSVAARLAVEVERLSAELAASRQRIGELENRIFRDMQWAERSELPAFDFLEADVKLVSDLAAGKIL